MNLKININGALSLFLVVVMIVLVLAAGKGSYFFYALIAIVPYVTTIYFLTRRRVSRRFTRRYRTLDDRLGSIQMLIGTHLMFVLWLLGLFLDLNFLLQLVYYFVAMVVGITLPFILISRDEQRDKRSMGEF
jgi:Flp pilus assembly protein TadB